MHHARAASRAGRGEDGLDETGAENQHVALAREVELVVFVRRRHG